MDLYQAWLSDLHRHSGSFDLLKWAHLGTNSHLPSWIQAISEPYWDQVHLL